MQFDFFNEAPRRTLEPITLLEHASSDYAPRTGENARGADVTVAFAADFTTAGERLTHRVAGARYAGIPFGSDVEQAVQALRRKCLERGGFSLNVAGNGIYTLGKLGVTQAQANQWVYEVLARLHALGPLTAIRSGGQTGIDTAGLVAGIALQVPVTGLWPKGFRQRLENQRDVLRTQDELMLELQEAAAALTLVSNFAKA